MKFNDSGVVFCGAADVSVDSDSCVVRSRILEEYPIFCRDFLLISAGIDGELCAVSVLLKYVVRTIISVGGSADRMLGYVRWKT